jgi:hypothetical protein
MISTSQTRGARVFAWAVPCDDPGDDPGDAVDRSRSSHAR